MPTDKAFVHHDHISKRHRPTKPDVVRRRGWVISCIISSVFFYFCGAFTVEIFWWPREALFGAIGGVKSQLVPVDTVPVWGSALFEKTFYKPSSDLRDSAHWNETYPGERGGVFEHKPHHLIELPILAEMVVFQQLHCIDDIECSLSQTTGAAACSALTPIPKNRVKHCIGYLRRTVKCAVDTHLEHEEKLYIRQGNAEKEFRHSRVCRDFNQVKNFVRQFESSDKGIRIDTITHEVSEHLPNFS